ncbi:MAG: hypothetical protein ACJAVH_001182, partial [Bacteroidia bacterium]
NPKLDTPTRHCIERPRSEVAISSGLLRDPIPGDLHKHKIPS